MGQGAFGKVYKGYRLTDDLEVAIKEIDLSLSQDKSILNEISMLSKLEHPNVVRYYDAVRVIRRNSRRHTIVFTSLRNIAVVETWRMPSAVTNRTTRMSRQPSTCFSKSVRDSTT